MTNEEFWKRLDKITEHPQTFETTRLFLSVLAEGYAGGNQILILGVENLHAEDTVNQACTIDEDGKKAMLYFTDKRHAKHSNVITSPLIVHQPKCVTAYACDVIDNALEKDEVKALVFNQGTDQVYVIPKIFLMVHFEKNGLISL